MRAGQMPLNDERGRNIMGKIVLTEFMSLDGVIGDPQWTFQFQRGPEGDEFKNEELFAADALLLGRVTYQGFAQAWPNMTEGYGDFGVRMNTIRKYVVSSTLTDAEANWGETTVIRDDVVAEITKLKAEADGNLLVEGSSQLTQTLIAHGLVDDYRLMVFPIVLGSGKRLFPDGMDEAATLTLTSNKTVGDGILLLTYQAAPAPATTGA
jgi:dihydrofolate reductase